MGRTVYLASSFNLKARVEYVCDELTDAGHDVPDQWWTLDLKAEYGTMPDDEWYEHEDVIEMAERHWTSIENSDAFVLVCPVSQPKKFNGGNVELGYAHAHDLDLYTVGALERSAMYEPVERVETVPELLDALERGD